MAETTHTKVFWTAQEKAALCQKAAQLMHELRASRKRDALLQAQLEVLPANRHRKLLALTGMDWFTDGVTRELDILRAAAATPPPPVEPPHPAPEELVLAQLWPLVRKRLVSELAAFVSDVLQEVKWPVGAPTPEAAKATVDETVRRLRQETRAKPRVLVVGLRGGQLEEIRKDFSSSLDLRFFGADENKDKLRSMCEQADHSVAMTDFISHSHEEILSKRARHYIRSSGGVTRLKSVLVGLQLQQESATA